MKAECRKCFFFTVSDISIFRAVAVELTTALTLCANLEATAKTASMPIFEATTGGKNYQKRLPAPSH